MSIKTVLTIAREGSFPGEKVGRAWRFLRSDVLAVVRGTKDTAKSVEDSVTARDTVCIPLTDRNAIDKWGTS